MCGWLGRAKLAHLTPVYVREEQSINKREGVKSSDAIFGIILVKASVMHSAIDSVVNAVLSAKIPFPKQRRMWGETFFLRVLGIVIGLDT